MPSFGTSKKIMFCNKFKAHFCIFSGLQCLLHNLHGKRRDVKKVCSMACGCTKCVYLQYGGDHKVHSFSFFDINLPTVQVRYHFVITIMSKLLNYSCISLPSPLPAYGGLSWTPTDSHSGKRVQLVFRRSWVQIPAGSRIFFFCGFISHSLNENMLSPVNNIISH